MDSLLRQHPYQAHPFYKNGFEYYKPSSWDFNDLILTRLSETEQIFASGEVTGEPLYWLFSSEIEFSIDILGSPPSCSHDELLQHHADVREKIIQKIQDPTERARRIQAIEKFDFRDVIAFMMYDALEDIVEPRFGREEHGIGYYDNPGIIEVRLKPALPEQFLINYHTAIAKLHDVGTRYDVCPKIERNHINFSPNRMVDGMYQSLIESSSSDLRLYDQTTRIFAGILKTFVDAELLTCRRTSGKIVYQDLGTSRGHMFRIAKNRAEYRAGDGEADHMANYVLQIMGGARYGLSLSLEQLAACDVKIPHRVKAGIFDDLSETADKPFGDSFYTTRILEGSAIDDNGSPLLPERYIKINKGKIEKEFFDREPDQGFLGFFDEGNPLEADISEIQDAFHGASLATDLTLKHNADSQKQSSATLARHFENIQCKGTFQTIACEGYFNVYPKDEWNKYVAEFYHSAANRVAYGDEIVESYSSVLAEKLFYSSIFPGNKTEPAECSVEREVEKIEQLMNVLPSGQQKKMWNEIQNACVSLIENNQEHMQDAIKLVEDNPECADGVTYWGGVQQRRARLQEAFLIPLLDAVQSRSHADDPSFTPARFSPT